MIRTGAPEPPAIFIGSAIRSAPLERRRIDKPEEPAG